MKRQKLTVEERKIIGKKVRKLRKEGLLPANVYGKKIQSFSIQMNQKAFESIFKEVGQTGLIDLELDGKTHPVLVKNIQLSYPSRTPLHVDFYQVDLTEKVKAMVPLVIAGEAKAVADNTGILLQQLSEVEVEALPEKLPENIPVNVEKLSAVDEQITVGALQVPEGITILTDPEQVVVKIGELVTKEAQEEAEAQAAAAAEQQAAKAEGGAAETTPVTQEPKEGEEKSQETATRSESPAKPEEKKA